MAADQDQPQPRISVFQPIKDLFTFILTSICIHLLDVLRFTESLLETFLSGELSSEKGGHGLLLLRPEQYVSPFPYFPFLFLSLLISPTSSHINTHISVFFWLIKKQKTLLHPLGPKQPSKSPRRR
ncbi:hypothetical protein GGS20DRAFT_110385 [Poronia punctata]|nr:hypothetical protein GGS20DRAFT_110385 [Poronia punctata]